MMVKKESVRNKHQDTMNKKKAGKNSSDNLTNLCTMNKKNIKEIIILKEDENSINEFGLESINEKKTTVGKNVHTKSNW